MKLVPGPMNAPMPAIVHGGEIIGRPQSGVGTGGVTIIWHQNAAINGFFDFKREILGIVEEAQAAGSLRR